MGGALGLGVLGVQRARTDCAPRREGGDGGGVGGGAFWVGGWAGLGRGVGPMLGVWWLRGGGEGCVFGFRTPSPQTGLPPSPRKPPSKTTPRPPKNPQGARVGVGLLPVLPRLALLGRRQLPLEVGYLVTQPFGVGGWFRLGCGGGGGGVGRWVMALGELRYPQSHTANPQNAPRTTLGPQAPKGSLPPKGLPTVQFCLHLLHLGAVRLGHGALVVAQDGHLAASFKGGQPPVKAGQDESKAGQTPVKPGQKQARARIKSGHHHNPQSHTGARKKRAPAERHGPPTPPNVPHHLRRAVVLGWNFQNPQRSTPPPPNPPTSLLARSYSAFFSSTVAAWLAASVSASSRSSVMDAL